MPIGVPSTLKIQKANRKDRSKKESVYKPYGAVRDMFYSREAELLIEGVAGSGKSRGCLEKLHLCAMKYPGMRGAIVRKTRESLTQSVLVTLENKVFPYPGAVPFHHEDQEYRYPNDSRIIVAGMDKESRIMSSEYDMIYVAEATELAETEWETLLTRVRNAVMPYQQLIGDCNPDDAQHWLNRRCMRGTTKRLVSTHEDNPTLWDHALNDWTPEGASYIAKLDSLTGYRYKRLRLGLWVAAEGMFFEEWDESVHIIPPFDIPPDWTRWTSTDYGYADPWCTLWFARDPADKHHIYIYREIYATGVREEQQAKQIVKASTGEHISLHIGDPSMFNKRPSQNKGSFAATYWKNGVHIHRAMNDRKAGWGVVRSCLAHDEGQTPRLQIIRGRAPNLVRTLPSMVHDPLDSEDLADTIRSQKTEDHAVDALRYGIVVEALPERQPARTRNFAVVSGAEELITKSW